MRILPTASLATPLLTLAFLSAAPAESSEKSPEAIAQRVANHLIEQTTFDFHNRKTGERFEAASDELVNTDFRVRSPYNVWHYGNGVLLLGMLSLSEATEDDRYQDFATHYFDETFKSIAVFKNHYGEGRPWVEHQRYFRTQKLDDCGAMATAIFEASKLKKRPEYAPYFETVGDFILNYEHRLEDGAFYVEFPRDRSVWADHVYMSAPFLVRRAEQTGDTRYLDEALRQLHQYHQLLWNDSRQVYHHGYYADEGIRSFAHWSRANGWIAMAKVEILKYLPVDHPQRDWVVSSLRQQIIGLSNYQAASGLWHQLLDRPDSFEETSGTAMFTYAIAYAVNEELIHRDYLQIAEHAWDGLASQVTAEGTLLKCCEGTGIHDDVFHYLNRKTTTPDLHGSGPLLLAAAELIKAQR
ncbi:glycoside hydrolase family 88 protein [Pelagicoccus sp. SDUM812005]|uniref:glycoside hydrolase family 88/105 protein n=1 Tax=Pelagicoccus sp. SDUM812005 TaxID=3041257 RepID=UPI00280CCBB9|nr:glycoside hydrolase family 88 protein [Pelagicoccus sp. SDUM812005]MDQ8181433.1 glycoside hydrolase family 88 protein [Pelagicoccus sp. SDUM812005]